MLVTSCVVVGTLDNKRNNRKVAQLETKEKYNIAYNSRDYRRREKNKRTEEREETIVIVLFLSKYLCKSHII